VRTRCITRGEPPAHEDHDSGSNAEPERLVLAAGRSRGQATALDLLDAPAPMTEAQVARLDRRGEWPANESHAPARPPRTDALDVRLEMLEAAARGRRGLSPAMAGELVTLRGAQAAAARARRREQRQA
jgi:hypothetical protein